MAGGSKVTNYCKNAAKKINKIRWQLISKEDVVEKPTVFATGSWDDVDNELCLWTLPDLMESAMDDENKKYTAMDPDRLCSVRHSGDVTDLMFYEPRVLVVTSSTGNVSVYKHHINSQTISVDHSWTQLHRYSEGGATDDCPCTAIASRGDNILATVGQDGRLCILDLNDASVSSIDNADSCSLNAVVFLSQSDVAAVNSVGQFKVWDTRRDTGQPVRVCALTGERFPLHCLDRHPTQAHIVVTGGQDGALNVWDMRKERYPITTIQGHASDMWEVRFHATHPDHLFTCSNDGSVWHWDSAASGGQAASAMSLFKTGFSGTATPRTNAPIDPNTTSAWLSGSKRNLETFDLFAGNKMSANSLDIQSNTLICGTDAEQICIVDGLAIA